MSIRGKHNLFSGVGAFVPIPLFFLLFFVQYFLLFFSTTQSICFSSELKAADSPIYLAQSRLSRLFFCSDPLSFHYANPKSQQRLRTWVHTFGVWSDLGNSTWFGDLNYHGYGISAGIDCQIGRNFLFGVSLGGNRTSIQNDNEIYGWKSGIESIFSSTYVRLANHSLFLDLEAGIGNNDQSLPSRAMFQWNINSEIGTSWQQGLGKVEPYLGLRYVSLHLKPEDESKTTLLVGVRYSWKTTTKFSVTTPRLYTGLIQELGGKNLLNTALFADTPTVFLIPNYSIPETRFFLGGGFTSSMGSSLDLYLRYNAELASNFSTHIVTMGMNWNY